MEQIHKERLLALANILLALPETYDKFDMSVFYRSKDTHFAPEPVEVAKKPEPYHCGTVACALGHSMAIPGVSEIVKDRVVDDWDDLAEVLFGLEYSSKTWMYLFSGVWEDFDNTPKGAAERILKVLNGLEPTHFDLPWRG